MNKENAEYQEDKTTYASLKRMDEYAWLKEIEDQSLIQVVMD